ncbi:MAG: alkaline shock response membrane anchor protein AmaP [Halanaerobiaceae bacterium]
MNLFYRFIIFVIVLLVLFVSASLMFYSFGWANVNSIPEFVQGLYQQWEYGLLFILLFAAASWIISPFFSDKSVTPISKSDIGEVDITLDALDRLVNNIALEQEGIVSIKNRLKSTDKGLIIYLTARIFPSMSIPEIANSLQNLVKSYIEETSGVNVLEVRVLVDNVSDGRENDVE